MEETARREETARKRTGEERDETLREETVEKDSDSRQNNTESRQNKNERNDESIIKISKDFNANTFLWAAVKINELTFSIYDLGHFLSKVEKKAK